MRAKIVAGNWKMNGQRADVSQLVDDLLYSIPASNIEVVIFPPSIFLPLVQERLKNSSINWGGQNVFPASSGAFTGEISSLMLKDYGCRYVLVGHSERRVIFKEDEKFIADKFHHIKEHDMIPILCIGETLDERNAGQTKAVLARQLSAVVQNNSSSFDRSIIAYEPMWAIGTGQTATPEQVQETHLIIRELLSELCDTPAQALPLVYGGSVNEKNAAALLNMPEVDGGLIGGASLNARQFVEIIKCIN